MVKWESQSMTPPQSLEDGHIYCILLIRIAFCHVSENLPLRCLYLRHNEHLFLFSMLILHVTSSRFCLYLLNIYHFTYTISPRYDESWILTKPPAGISWSKNQFFPISCQYIQRHTHTGTHVQSAHKRNGDNQAQEPG